MMPLDFRCVGCLLPTKGWQHVPPTSDSLSASSPSLRPNRAWIIAADHPSRRAEFSPPQAQRTLRIRLPGAGDTENHLAAALARVPWEIARPRADAQTLGERNLLVRVVHDMPAPVTASPGRSCSIGPAHRHHAGPGRGGAAGGGCLVAAAPCRPARARGAGCRNPRPRLDQRARRRPGKPRPD
jgi:hypothetical protein